MENYYSGDCGRCAVMPLCVTSAPHVVGTFYVVTSDTNWITNIEKKVQKIESLLCIAQNLRQ